MPNIPHLLLPSILTEHFPPGFYCRFCLLCLLSCSEQRLWDEGHLFWQQGRSSPARLSYSTALDGVLLCPASLLGCVLHVCLHVWLREDVEALTSKHRPASDSFCTGVHIQRQHCPHLLTSLCLLCDHSVNVPMLADTKSCDREGADLWI